LAANNNNSVFKYEYCCLCGKFGYEIIMPEHACIDCIEKQSTNSLFESIEDQITEHPRRGVYKKKQIICVTKGGANQYGPYNSIIEAANAHGVNRSLVSKSSTGKYEIGVTSKTLHCKVFFREI